MGQITNGAWSLIFTNGSTSNFYTFTVSAPTMTSNTVPVTAFTYPTNGEVDVPNDPTFTWIGPTNWFVTTGNTYLFNYNFSFFQYPAPLPASQTSWTETTPFPNGLDCSFALDYMTNDTPPIFVASNA